MAGVFNKYWPLRPRIRNKSCNDFFADSLQPELQAVQRARCRRRRNEVGQGLAISEWFRSIPGMTTLFLLESKTGMARTLRILFRRDPSRDRHREQIQYEGYQILWPDGRPVAVGLDAFCKHGQRLLGLGRHLAGCTEKLMELVCFPLQSRDDDLNRIPGHRVRRFFLARTGRVGRIHFLDGTPTAAVFELDRDEPRVLNWIGLPLLHDGQRQWMDLAARTLEPAFVGTAHCMNHALADANDSVRPDLVL